MAVIKMPLKAIYICLDYFLLFFSPLSRLFGKTASGFYLDLINLAYFPRVVSSKRDRKAHKTLESFREDYDKLDVNFYDHFLGEQWAMKKKVLDIGCFVGAKAEYVSHQGAKEVIGIDLSNRGIEVAKKFENEKLSFLEVGSSELAKDSKFQDEFDFIISFTVFEHIDKEIISTVLKDSYALLKPGGKLAVAYNHYYDRFGSHSNHYIAYPWPQLIVSQKNYQAFCDKKLRELHAKGEMGYFPKGFSYQEDGHNNDCFMALNKIDHREFLEIAAEVPFIKVESIPYGRFSKYFYKYLPLKVLHPSFFYIFEK